MELKLQQARQELAKERGSNRTFMELKLLTSPIKQAISLRSNRTFMELKLANQQFEALRKLVLIVPLWN